MNIDAKQLITLISVVFLYSCGNEIKLPEEATSQNWRIEKNRDISGVQLRPLTVNPYYYGLFFCKDSMLVPESIKRLYDSEFNGYVAAVLESYSPTNTHIQVTIMAIGYVVKDKSEFSLVPLAEVNFTDEKHSDVMEEWYLCSITHPDLVE